MDSLSDTLVNVFKGVKKPDARFVEMSAGLERFEDGLGQIDRLVSRNKNRVDGELAPFELSSRQTSRQTTRTWRQRIRALAISSLASRSR